MKVGDRVKIDLPSDKNERFLALRNWNGRHKTWIEMCEEAGGYDWNKIIFVLVEELTNLPHGVSWVITKLEDDGSKSSWFSPSCSSKFLKLYEDNHESKEF